MGEFRDELDAEARRVGAEPDALERLKARALRRRIRRQVGSGMAALAVASAGFAFAFTAFRGPGEDPRADRPTPVSSASPDDPWKVVGVTAPVWLEREAVALTSRISDAGYATVPANTVRGGFSRTLIVVIEQPGGNGPLELARQVRREFIPDAEVRRTGCYGFACGPPIEIFLGADYREAINAGIRVRVLDGSGIVGALAEAVAKLEGAGYDVVETGTAGNPQEHTFFACAPQNDLEAERIRRELFPGAGIQVEIPDEEHDVTLYLGSDIRRLDSPTGVTVGEGAPDALRHVRQGDAYWAVYIAISDDGDAIQAVAEEMTSQGVPVSTGDMACDRGNTRVLPGRLPEPRLQRVAAYFHTRVEADAFAAALDPPPVGIARVRTYCLD
jgi:LytR cell envelope-related transcriptional attenuator